MVGTISASGAVWMKRKAPFNQLRLWPSHALSRIASHQIECRLAENPRAVQLTEPNVGHAARQD